MPTVDNPPDVIGQILTAILGCAEQKLIDYERPAGRVNISPGGPPAWDECCDGFLWTSGSSPCSPPLGSRRRSPNRISARRTVPRR
jgi:hypothetical protein